VLLGGRGSDTLVISDLDFIRLAGGNGVDTLRLAGAGLNLDLTSISDNRITGTEVIDIRGAGANTLSLDALEVLNLSDTSNQLMVFKNSDDTVNGLETGWTINGTEMVDGQRFDVYVQGAARVLVSASEVIEQHIFYNESWFDGQNPVANAADDGAIAGDKFALMPGGTASFANYTSYDKGINGIIIDIDNLPDDHNLNKDDFLFRVGNGGSFDQLDNALAPSVEVRDGEGINGSDRVTLIWGNASVLNEWLEVTVLDTGNTELGDSYVFYFGNAVGETGDNQNGPADAQVTISDLIDVRSNALAPSDPALINNLYDFNRDTRVNLFDFLIARDNPTDSTSALMLITVPLPQEAPPVNSAPAPLIDLSADALATDTSQGDSRSIKAPTDSIQLNASMQSWHLAHWPRRTGLARLAHAQKPGRLPFSLTDVLEDDLQQTLSGESDAADSILSIVP